MDYKQRVAAGLRNMNTIPDAFLFCGEGELCFNEPTLFSIPVFHSALVINTMPSFGVDFIPMWNNEDDYIVERSKFNSGYESYFDEYERGYK